MKPIYIKAVFFSEEKVMFPLKTDPLRYHIQYSTRQVTEENLKKIRKEEICQYKDLKSKKSK